MYLATLTDDGRAAIALALASQTFHLAWGAGEESWEILDAEGVGTLRGTLRGWKALKNEYGRRSPASVSFAMPDEQGGIVIPTVGETYDIVKEVRYSQSAEPTPYLYVRTNFDYADTATGVIRELGLFMGTKVKPDLPPGRRYFRPADILEPGRLVAVQFLLPGMTRAANVRQTVEYVLPI